VRVDKAAEARAAVDELLERGRTEVAAGPGIVDGLEQFVVAAARRGMGPGSR
jgi:hypothetical protein